MKIKIKDGLEKEIMAGDFVEITLFSNKKHDLYEVIEVLNSDEIKISTEEISEVNLSTSHVVNVWRKI